MKNMKRDNIYKAGFTAGGLLFKESEKAIPFLIENGIDNAQVLRENPEYLGTNSISSRKKMVREILYRYEALDKVVWNEYINFTRKDKCLLLYMSCLLTYPILHDFHFKVVLKKWKEISDQVKLADFHRFMDEATAQHPEIDEWTESTRTKMGTVSIRMLKESGFIVNGKLITPDPGISLLNLVVESGNSWFLEALLLPKPRRDELIK